MNFRFLLFFFPAFLLQGNILKAQRPKLVIGITVDQMRWDYLHRYQERWHPKGGFTRMLNDGYSCERNFINYIPSYTACGHASIYTGSVPALHGITGNNWFDNVSQQYMYCTTDTAARTVGNTGDGGQMSPANLLGTTISDELRMAVNFRNKTIGIALKDRGGILPAGHTANAAYWYDANDGKWITSSYYMNTLPEWVSRFNASGKVDSLYALNWEPLYKKESYVQSQAGPRSYELRTFGSPDRQFPYDFKRYIGKNYGVLPGTPHGNTLTTLFAQAAVIHEKLGADSITDFLTISYSSIDYIGHAFGPNAMETEDAFLRLDRELGVFFDFLDKEVGKGQYLIFLTSDHGAAHVPGYAISHKMPAGFIQNDNILKPLNEAMRQKFGLDNLAKTFLNNQLYLDIPLIKKTKKLSVSDVTEFIVEWLQVQPAVVRAFRLDQAARETLPEKLNELIRNGYMPARSGHIQIIFQPGYIEGFATGGTTHGTGYAYDTRIPLLWYGWKIAPGKLQRNTYITDIAPTLAAILGTQEPSTSIGNVITEVVHTYK